ncbi:hypothetical protein [Pseudomonas sp. GD03766]|uniref:hypothetical protein n=1 Tax=Pseudomonas sp. GD03766 TaxID=2975379 RepID=UPI00244981A0|nr:hypothetical protein [Pseudomonas sp. GD03766]MDH1692552.1 hypothetical protein [Pseudomonas sp. GD03766]
MKIEIMNDESGTGCKVIIDGLAVTFTTTGEAEAYVARLQERLQAAPHAFAASAEPSA